MADDVAASLRVVVDADTSRAERGLADFGGKLDAFSIGMGVALGGAAIEAGKKVAEGLSVAVTAAGNLQQSVANISTIKPDIDTSAVFASLNAMQTRVPQSASQLGDALYNVFSSFQTDTEGALKLTEQFAQGAVGAQTNAQTFGTSILGVMNAYGASVDQASHISDVFFNTVNAGVVTGQELAASLGPVTQSAKAAGVSIDELGGFIAGVTKEGGPAAQNINNLNNFLQKMTTTEAQKALKDLGIATKTATGDFRPTTDVLEDLKAKLNGMTEAGRANALQKIFPDAQARQGAATLISQLDFVKDAIDNNRKSTGSAAAAYEKMSQTFQSQSVLAKNAFISVLTTIGNGFLPVLTRLMGGAASVLTAWQPTVALFSAQIPGAIDAVSTAIGDLFAIFTGAEADAFEESPFFNLDAYLGPQATGAIVDAISQLGGAWRTFIQVLTTDEIPDMWSAPGQLAVNFGLVLKAIGQNAIPILQGALGLFSTYLNSIVVPALSGLYMWLAPNLQGALSWLAVTGLPAAQNALTMFANVIPTIVFPALQGLWDWLSTNVGGALNMLTTFGWPLLQNAMTLVAAWISTTAVPTLTSLWSWLSEKVGTALTWLTETAWPAMGNAANAVQNWMSSTLAETLKTAWDWLKNQVGAALTWLTTDGWPKMQAAASTAWQWLTGTLFPSLATLYNWLAPAVSTSIGAALAWMKETGWPNLQSAMTAVWNWLQDPFFPTLQRLYNWLAPSVEGSIGVALTWLAQTGWPNVKNAMIDAASIIQTQVWPWFQTLFLELDKRQVLQDVAVFLGNIKQAADDLLADFPGLTSGFKGTHDQAGPAADSATDLATAIKSISKAMADWSSGPMFDQLDAFNQALYQVRLGMYNTEEYIRDMIDWIYSHTPGTGGGKPPDWLSHHMDPPERPEPVQRPSSGGGGGSSGGGSGGGSGGSSGGASGPGSGSGGGAGSGSGPVVPTQPPTSVTPGQTGSDIDNSSLASFWRTASPYMLDAAGGNKDLAAMMLAAAHTENGSVGGGGPFWANNFFGIKGEGPAGTTGPTDTWEQGPNGERLYQKAGFAKFHDPIEGMNGFMWFLKANPRYGDSLATFAKDGNAVELFQNINDAGYATDDGWWKMVKSVRENQVRPVVGYAGGGWAGLHGPELAVLGERGPEYVVPNRALGSGGRRDELVIIVQVSDREAERIVVRGNEIVATRKRTGSVAL